MESLNLMHKDLMDGTIENCLSELVKSDKTYELIDLSFNRITPKGLETVLKFVRDRPNVSFEHGALLSTSFQFCCSTIAHPCTERDLVLI